jgi:hypothetical protein
LLGTFLDHFQSPFIIFYSHFFSLSSFTSIVSSLNPQSSLLFYFHCLLGIEEEDGVRITVHDENWAGRIWDGGGIMEPTGPRDWADNWV